MSFPEAQLAPTMAATAISLRFRTNKPLRIPTFLHHFSSSTSSSPLLPNPSSDLETPNSPSPNSQSSFTSYFSDVNSSLRKHPPPSRQQPGQYGRGFTPQLVAPTQAASFELRTNIPLRIPTLLHHFSSSTSSSPLSLNPSSDLETPNSPSPNSQSSFTSYFSDVKSSLRQHPPPLHQQPGEYGRGFTPQLVALTQAASFEQIRKDLSEFHTRSTAPKASEDSSAPRISFQELYKRNITSKEGDAANEANKSGKLSFKAIRESLSQLQVKTPTSNKDPLSLRKFKESFTLRPGDLGNDPFVIGPQKKLPEPVFSNDLNDKKTSPAMKTEFVKMYSYKELGEKLRKLRPEGKPEGGFSLQELNERLVKLREMEEKDTASKIGSGSFRDLRGSLIKLKFTENKLTLQKLDFLNQIGQTPTFMLHPLKEHLVEKYFHPDNMSSAEKLKTVLQKVRDEFRMSETDCGSARVQVAQLTTKIKHLATVLHKKDKHSRKGLQEMIQHRKKLLKYLRRTDWDSYTLVLSKLGLRDNPDYKN